jgi:hypothetical protein
MEKKIICKDCKKEFIYQQKGRYYRKYCDTCSKKRKQDYKSIHLITADDCED